MNWFFIAFAVFLIYLLNQRTANVSSQISLLPGDTPVGSPITAPVPSNTTGVTLPSNATINSDGTINVAGGVLAPVPVSNPAIGVTGTYTVAGITYSSLTNQPVSYQYIPNSQPPTTLTSSSTPTVGGDINGDENVYQNYTTG